jgi:hypothetical protein
MQSAYQVTWMLLILFLAPAVFDRYHIRDHCEAFNFQQRLHVNHPYFCDHKDVVSLSLSSQLSPSEVCSKVAFPVTEGNCPTLPKATLERVTATNLCSGEDCKLLLNDAHKVCTLGCALLSAACSLLLLLL